MWAHQQNAAIAFKASAASVESICSESDCGKMVRDDFHTVPLSRVPRWPTEEHTRGSRGEIVFHSNAGPVLWALIVAHLSSELISGLANRWRRNDSKYATRCSSSAWWRRDFRARLRTGRKSWKTVKEKGIKILFSVDVLLLILIFSPVFIKPTMQGKRPNDFDWIQTQPKRARVLSNLEPTGSFIITSFCENKLSKAHNERHVIFLM